MWGRIFKLTPQSQEKALFQFRKGKMQASIQRASVWVLTVTSAEIIFLELRYVFEYSFGWGLITAGLNHKKWPQVQGLNQ